MQQRLAVASVLALVILAGASAVLIAHNAYGQNAPKASTQTLTSHDTTASTSSGSSSSTNSTSSGGSLLTTTSHNTGGQGDDGNETEHETETQTQTGANFTLDD